MTDINAFRIVKINNEYPDLHPASYYLKKNRQKRLCDVIKYLRQEISRNNRVWVPSKNLKELIKECKDRHFHNKDLLNELDKIADNNDPCWIQDCILTEILNVIEAVNK